MESELTAQEVWMIGRSSVNEFFYFGDTLGQHYSLLTLQPTDELFLFTHIFI